MAGLRESTEGAIVSFCGRRALLCVRVITAIEHLGERETSLIRCAVSHQTGHKVICVRNLRHRWESGAAKVVAFGEECEGDMYTCEGEACGERMVVAAAGFAVQESDDIVMVPEGPEIRFGSLGDFGEEVKLPSLMRRGSPSLLPSSCSSTLSGTSVNTDAKAPSTNSTTFSALPNLVITGLNPKTPRSQRMWNCSSSRRKFSTASPLLPDNTSPTSFNNRGKCDSRSACPTRAARSAGYGR